MLAAAALGLLLGALGTLLIAGVARERVAIVDVERIFVESKLAKEYNAKLEKEAKERRDALIKIPGAQREQKSKEYQLEMEKLRADYREEVLKSLDGVLAGLAKRHGLDAIYVKGTVVRYCRLDLTDEVMEKMK